MLYAMGTELVQSPGPFSCGFSSGKALCSDGKVRAIRFQNGGIADTFFSIPASVKVGGKTVSGFVMVETLEGFSTETKDDPAVVKFIAYTYRKNGGELPRGCAKKIDGEIVSYYYGKENESNAA